MNRTSALAVLLLALSLGPGTTPAAAGPDAPKPRIQLAILLDTSNSMDGLIDQAKSQLWKIVNELATARQNGRSPELQVALYEYGNDGLPGSEGHIRLVLPLSADLDKVSEELFKLRTNGGDEYCGQVIGRAAKQLDWSKSGSDLKLIFIAGNEPFTQGPADFRATCKEAISKGIVVNTIFCGSHQEGIDTHWKAGADLADGRYMNIDQNRAVVAIATPQDAPIAALNVELNKTYLAYGAAGKKGKARQEAQDANASTVNAEVVAQRTVAKASGQYKNVDWDIVDAAKDGQVKVEEMKETDLPEEMRRMTVEERKAYLAKLSQKREEIQKQIRQLSAERDKYIQEQRQKQPGEETLDTAVLKSVRSQAEKKNFEFEKK